MGSALADGALRTRRNWKTGGAGLSPPAEVSLESTTVIAPPASNNAAETLSANLSFIQVITLSVPFTRARVEAATAGPLITVAVMVVASPTGAAWAALAEIAPARASVVEEMPCLEK